MARERVVLHVADDANDDSPVALELIEALGRVGEIDLVADGALAGPKLARENIVDDGDVQMLGIVGIGEVAAFQEHSADGSEVSGQGGAVIGHNGGLLRGRGALAIVVVVPVAGVVEREVGDRGGGPDAGKRGEFLLHEVQRCIGRNGGAEGEDVGGAEAGVGMEDVDESAHEQASTGEQHKSERDFGRDEGAGPGTAQAGRLAAGFSEVAGEVDAADGKHRGEAEEHADAQRDGEGEDEHASIEGDTIEVGKGGRPRGEEGVNSSVSGSERGDAAEDSEQQAFGEELPRKAEARGTECSAERGFAQTTPRAGHEEVGDVGAAGEKHETNPAEKAEDGRADFADRVGLEWKDRDGKVAQGSASAELVELCGGGVHLGLRRGDCCAIAEAADDVKEGGTVGLPRPDGDGVEDFDVGRNAGIVGKDEPEACGQHADHRGAMLAVADGATDNRGSEPKRRAQTPWVRMMVLGAFSRSSCGPKKRPSAGRGQRSGRKLEVTSATLICSAGPSPGSAPLVTQMPAS